MGDDIGSGLLSMAVCFDFRSTNLVQLSNRTRSSTCFNVNTHKQPSLAGPLEDWITLQYLVTLLITEGEDSPLDIHTIE
jgi:hypothetical protein